MHGTYPRSALSRREKHRLTHRVYSLPCSEGRTNGKFYLEVLKSVLLKFFTVQARHSTVLDGFDQLLNLALLSPCPQQCNVN